MEEERMSLQLEHILLKMKDHFLYKQNLALKQRLDFPVNRNKTSVMADKARLGGRIEAYDEIIEQIELALTTEFMLQEE